MPLGTSMVHYMPSSSFQQHQLLAICKPILQNQNNDKEFLLLVLDQLSVGHWLIYQRIAHLSGCWSTTFSLWSHTDSKPAQRSTFKFEVIMLILHLHRAKTSGICWLPLISLVKNPSWRNVTVKTNFEAPDMQTFIMEFQQSQIPVTVLSMVSDSRWTTATVMSSRSCICFLICS